MRANQFAAKMFAQDLKASIQIRDKRAADNAAARARCQNDPQLCAILLADAKRRGQSGIDWPEYFRNIDINYP